MRLLLGIFAGLLTAALWIALILGFAQWFFPPPDGLDPSRPEDLTRIAEATPFAGQMLMVVAWFVAALAGGMVANAIAQRWWAAILIAGAVIAPASALTLLLPYPMWLKLAGVATPLLAAEFANRLVRTG